MSDSRLRELERAWLETRALEPEVAFLGESLRVGALTLGRLQLAALCGHVAARAALERAGAPRPPEAEDFAVWAYLSSVPLADRFGAALAAIAAAARAVDEAAETARRDLGLPLPSRASLRSRDAAFACLSRWLVDHRSGVTQSPARQRVGERTAVHAALKRVHQAADAVARLPTSNVADVALARALVDAASVLGEAAVLRIVGTHLAPDVFRGRAQP